ncbi:MAG TPA: 50S ribosomal protein L29 [Candidatus Nanoarchaeia archaeon]|nr:50S ribosomal protein L29 [Candidatus Nanoarchaeia archaeon]
MPLKNKEIRAMPLKAVNERLGEIQKELLKLSGQRATGAGQKNNQQIRILKRTKARLLTHLRQGGSKKK